MSLAATYDRLTTIEIDRVIPLILGTIQKKSRVELGGVMVSVAGARLNTFAQKGTICARCGLHATHFAIERPAKRQNPSDGYHLNLWGKHGDREILFTRDHIVAKACGGPDTLENSQTMCQPCNNKKGAS